MLHSHEEKGCQSRVRISRKTTLGTVVLAEGGYSRFWQKPHKLSDFHLEFLKKLCYHYHTDKNVIVPITSIQHAGEED